MKNKPLSNKDLAFKRKADKDRFMSLFNCFTCGFHETVIVKMWIEGNEDDFIVRIHHIHPENKETVDQVSSHLLKYDGKLIMEMICGKCGKSGHMENVPKDIIEMYGFKPFVDNDVQKPKKQNIMSRIFKKRAKKK